jgi:hypothetical protein
MTPRLSRRTVLQGGALSALGLLVAACGGDDGAGGDTTTPSTTPETDAPAATTADSAVATTTGATNTTTGGPTTTVVAGPVYPLTGLAVDDEVRAVRPAMVVKVDNHPQARPQYGLNQADIVFEENVESLTRFAVVLQSQDVERVGPVRSGRTQDIDLLGGLDKPLFVWSGGNANVTRAINGSDLVNLSPTTTKNDGFFREKRGSEESEHTLYARPLDLWAQFTPVYAPAPPPQFTYRAADEAFNGETATGVDVKMDGGVQVNWAWDAATASYLRSMNGKSHDDAENGQVNASNVVVLEVEYRPSPADSRSPEAQTVGTGAVYVFTSGVLVRGIWSRTDRLQPFSLVAEDGEVIGLTPGRTWVELARTGTTTPTS